MKLIVNKDRTTIAVGTWGTKNENDYEILDFEFPTELEEYNKRIVYYLGNTRVWDTIVDNKAYITNAITQYSKVKAYVWLTKENTEREADTDFRTKLFEMKFFENENADGIVPTEQQVDGFNTMLTQMNNAIDEIDDKIDEADAKIQQIDEAITGVENLNIDVSDKVDGDVTVTLTKKDNTTKTVILSDGTSLEFMWQGTSLGIKTEDDTEYTYVDLQGVQGPVGPKGDAFVIKKTYPSVEAMNADFNNMQVGDYVMIASTVELEDNAKLYTKGEQAWIFISDFSGAQGIKGETGATPNIQIGTVVSGSTPNVTRTGTNENPVLNFTLVPGEKGDKGDTGDTGATGNGIASIDKTSTVGYVDTYTITYTNGNTTTFTVTNGEVTQQMLDNTVAELQQEIDELSENMPWSETTQATEIQVTDAAKYSRNKLELFGNTSQDSYTGKNLLSISDGTYTGNGYTAVVSNGKITVNGTGLYTPSSVEIPLDNPINWSANVPLVLSAFNPVAQGNTSETGDYFSLRIGSTNNPNVVGAILGNQNATASKTRTTDVEITRLQIRGYTDGEFNNFVCYPQLELDSNIGYYEPYVGGQPAPNPDYPQDIHVVTGNNSVGVQGKNLCRIERGAHTPPYTMHGVTYSYKNDNIITVQGTSDGASGGESYLLEGRFKKGTYTISGTPNKEIGNDDRATIYIWYTTEPNTSLTNANETITGVYSSKTFTLTDDAKIGFRIISQGQNSGKTYNQEYSIQIEQGSSATDYVPYVAPQNYPINLGSLELCKIGDYQDYLYKENGNWYKYGIVRKYIGAATVNYTNRRIVLKGRSTLKNMDSSTNVPTEGIANCSISSNYRYNYGWQGLAFTITTEEMNMIGAQTSEEFKAWCDENLIAYVVTNPTYDDIDITQITDATLISQLDAIYEHLQLQKETNNITVTPGDIVPYIKLNYMQDLPSKLSTIESRISALEE